ncbi:Sortase family protein [Micromonospora carbonacea]|uniref:Sortase family protein n=1 Tax=Micromonospora carbonacea TaxID=47853 RepID=A0A1C4W6E4_9ACTN|nr:Sortase family protein [Micromonospora carbonacea]
MRRAERKEVVGGRIGRTSASPRTSTRPAIGRGKNLDLVAQTVTGLHSAPGGVPTVTATGGDGTTREYRVVAREEYAKTKVPLDRYFARDGSPRLTLITCGGPFDPQTRRYRDTIVVTAVPV